MYLVTGSLSDPTLVTLRKYGCGSTMTLALTKNFTVADNTKIKVNIVTSYYVLQ